ncbi:GGDEF domain-containing protein [Phytohabitans aurantiacus]|uniref:GGDEF domain-containing protein n=2 Tax=Phytohabitans aurantiacus TaxID=3016789 RepID=A0ABQ5RBS8_9ACTN|nr:GGDEF domain-containing protein [Phytohabitans aurantiacus]
MLILNHSDLGEVRQDRMRPVPVPTPEPERLAELWAQAIAWTSYVSMSRAELVAHLTGPASRVIEALGTDEPDGHIGFEVGTALVAAHFTHPTSLSRTLAVLGEHLQPYVDATGAGKRFARLQGSLAEGYAQALRNRTMTEQEGIYAAALVAQAEAEEARWASEARFQAVFTEAAIGIGIGTLSGRLLEVNRALCDMFGYPREEFLERTTASFFQPPGDDGDVWQAYNDLWAGRSDNFRTEKPFTRSDGAEIWTDLVVSLIRDKDGTPKYAVGMVEDITERHRLQIQLRHQALHDPLTDLPNRTLFFERLALALADPDPSARVGVCYLDLDGFKAVNDTLGHDVGDQLLRTVAGRLASRLHRSGHLVARMGGDEFVVLVERTAGTAELVRVAEAALAAVRIPVRVSGHALKVSASVGVVDRPVRGTTVAELMKAADTTLYWAKADGRDRWAVFDADRHANDVSRYRLSAQLPAALARRQFFVEYQPLVRLADGVSVGAEALVRWRHPERGVIGPGRFIELAEETGLIVPLGRWVLREACEQAQRWPESPRPLLSVNVAARQIRDATIVEDVKSILAETGLPAEGLQLELTESSVMGSSGQPLRTLHALADLGVRLAIDDFGTGYSNLAYLRSLPVHALKLAGSFMSGLRAPGGPDQVDQEILEAVIRLAHKLKMSVIAEGVETASQAAVLRELGCDTAQGWHFARSMAPSSLPWL